MSVYADGALVSVGSVRAAIVVLRRGTWVALALPLFFVLGVARLLVLAIPPVLIEQPAFLAHGFYQLLAGCLAIVVAAHVALRRQSGWAASRRALFALTMAGIAGLALGPRGISRCCRRAESSMRCCPRR